jgi:Zn-dependent M28 family amino/carboxypeptidase
MEGLPSGPLSSEESALQARLKGHVKVLAKDIGIRHCHDPKSYQNLQAAAAYIRSTWQSQGYDVQEQAYDVGREVKNLYVEIKGKDRPEEILVIGAHYDGVVDGPAANDNGSAVAALLEISRALAKTTPSRTLQFVAFVNEEPPFFQTEAMGSRVYASELASEKKNVVGMISLETIGCYFSQKGSQQYPWPFSLFYPDRGNFIAFVGNRDSRDWIRQCVKTFREESSFPSEGVAAPEAIQGIGWSDQWSFWQEGYPALMVTDTAPFRYKYYHTPQDTIDKIDFKDMTRVVSGLQMMVLRLAQ